MLGGLDAAGGRGVVGPADVGYVFYGTVFRPAGRLLGEDIPPYTAEDVEGELALHLLLSWWDAAARRDARVPAPTVRTLGARGSVRAALLALAGSKFLAHTSERVLVWWLRQVIAYFTDPEVRGAVQRLFAAEMRPETRVVVGHSLGSVVAYEALCAHPEWPVTDLVTLGSPLAAPHLVLHRLIPAPTLDQGRISGEWPGVDRWVNITDDGDFLALQPRLRHVFGERVVDVAISNGMAAHQAHRYLSAAECGAAVLAGLR